MSIGEKIRQFRLDAGLTQKQLGEKAGIAEPTIRKYELNKLNPKIETLAKISKALNISISVFNHDGIIYFNDVPDKKIEDMSPEELKALIRDLPKSMMTAIESLKKTVNDIESNLNDIELLNLYYSELNANGKKEAVKRLKELTMIDAYIDKDATQNK